MRPIRFSKKELGSAVLATCLALAAMQPSDHWVWMPMVVASWLACVYLAYHHQGGRAQRSGFAVLAALVLGFIGYRNSLASAQASLVVGSQERATPQIIFKDSPLFTITRRIRISDDVLRVREYLASLGIPAPLPLPPMGTHEGLGRVVYWSGSGNPLFQSLQLRESEIDNRGEATYAVVGLP